MVEQSASVTVKAPVHQVYELFTHFNDFPKFMSFVKEVTYYDGQRSHWVAHVLGNYAWDAVNEDWIADQQIGWRSTSGLRNSGKVKFRAQGSESTIVDVYIQYVPPTGPLGEIGVTLGLSAYFDSVLQRDLDHFARMVELAPPGALDPMSSQYLFHDASAAGRGQVTVRQKLAMAHDPMMSPQSMVERESSIKREEERRRKIAEEREAARSQQIEAERRARQEQQEKLAREVTRRQKQPKVEVMASAPLERKHVYAASARGLGDKDGLRVRDPSVTQDPMTTRRPRPATAPPASGGPSVE